MARNKGMKGPGSKAMGGIGMKPSKPPSMAVGTRAPGAPPPAPRAPMPKASPLSGGPMTVPGGSSGGSMPMKKGGVAKHEKGGAIGKFESKHHFGRGEKSEKGEKEHEKYARGGSVGHGDSKPRHRAEGSFK